MSTPASAHSEAKPSAGEWRLVVVTSDAVEQVGGEKSIGSRMTIGRDPSCDIVLPEGIVSRRHATIEPAPQGLSVVDSDSGNGVWVDGRRVKQSTLVAGQQFRIGSTVFECVAPLPVLLVAVDAPTTFIERPEGMLGPSLGSERVPFVIRILEGNEAGTSDHDRRRRRDHRARRGLHRRAQ